MTEARTVRVGGTRKRKVKAKNKLQSLKKQGGSVSDTNKEICPACGVTIEDGAKVLFSCGPAGTRERLWARVCQFAKRPGCINANTEALSDITEADYYN